MNATPSDSTPIERFVRPFREFAQRETSGGILLLACTVVALLWANSPWSAGYFHLWHINLSFGFGRWIFSEQLHFWINDGLMAIFFLFVGIEIKREMLVGELASAQRAALPIAAALGGMIVPALIYTAFNHNGIGRAGWGIPMATDIAFALGVLTLLGSRVPFALRIFLAALAIADDLGAVLVIALFYTEKISWISLAVVAVILVALIILNRAGARHPFWYAILGVALWLAFLKSGIHATIAGVLLALTVPARQRIDGRAFIDRSEKVLGEFREAEEAGESIFASARKTAALQTLVQDCERVEPPLLRFEHALAPWISYLIMPVFALANAGVALGAKSIESLITPIGFGILCGLFLGKPIGIVSFSWLATRIGLGSLPNHVGWRQIFGVGVLAGIGFTMSLFIARLAFGEHKMLDVAKVGILAASVLSGISGALILLSGKSGKEE